MIRFAFDSNKQGRNAGIWLRMRMVLRHAIELVTLHGQLADVEFQKWKGGLPVILAMIVGGIALVFGSIPVLIYCFAGLIQTWGALTQLQSLSLAATGFLLIGGGLATLGWFRLKRSFSTFDRTRAELARNMDWLKGRMSEEPVDTYSTLHNHE